MNSLELLPTPIMGHVLDQLNRVTGSKGIVNKADISVLMRYTCNLACTSKEIAAQVSHPNVTQIFLQSLSDKYGQSCEHFAALLNTISARKWLWEYIRREGDDQVYQVIQDIYRLAGDVLQEAKNAGLEFDCSEGRNEWPSPNPCSFQTKQGFVLYNNYSRCHIRTPLEEIELYSVDVYKGCSPYSISEILIKRLNAVFVHTQGLLLYENPFEIVASGSDTIRKISPEEIKEISKEEAESKKGTQNLITGRSAYNITEVNGKKVQEAVWYDKKQARRSHELIQMIWEMLEANRLGQDPIAKPITLKEVKASEAIKEPICKNIGEVSEWGVALAAKLQDQPIFSEKQSGHTKLMVLERGADALATLNFFARQFSDKDSAWIIYAFGDGLDRRTLNGEDLDKGIELCISNEHSPCDLNTLKKAYDLSIHSISQNWVKSDLKDHPAILCTKSEEDYVLFVKKDTLICEEYRLINKIADLLGVSEAISCNGHWEGQNSGTHLWIRKDNLEKTLKALNIES